MSVKKTFKRTNLAAGVAVALSLITTSAMADKNQVIELELGALNVQQATMTLSEKSGVQVVISEGVSLSTQLNAVSGSFDMASALGQMLQGTGLTYEFSSDDLVMIKEVESEAEGGSEEPDEELVITGTRLKGVASAGAQVIKITRDDFEKRGFTSMEDVLRSLPQNHGSGLANTAAAGGGNLTTNPNRANTGIGGDFANLRGLGADRTLVLVNGRRVAGSQIIRNTGIDLAGIPFNSIERIDILLDGGSAVYGSDAQGGVINIITRKDYSGLEVGARYQNESTGGSEQRLQFSFGHNWDGGSLLIGGTTEEVDPVVAAETLYGGTQDFRPFGGPDNRSISRPRMPAIGSSPFNRFVAPVGDAFESPLVDADFEPGGRLVRLPFFFFSPNDPVIEANKFDNPTQFFGIQSETDSAFVTIQQDLGDRVRAQLDVRYNEIDRVQQLDIPTESFSVPSSNAFNGTGGDVNVLYSFVSEVERGLLEANSTNSTSKSLAYDLSAEWDITDDWLLRGSYTNSEDEFIASEFGFVNTFGGVSPAFQALLDDANPETAFNPFGDGSTNTADLNGLQFLTDSLLPSTGETESFEFSLQNASLFELPGGMVSGLIGVEQRTQTRGDLLFPVIDEDSQITDVIDFAIDGGERDMFAYYFEFNVPIIGENNALPGIQQLTLSLQGRHDDYDYDPGASEFVDPVTASQVITDDFAADQEQFDRITQPFEFDSGLVPRVGIDWTVTDDFRVRMSYSESFRAPELADALVPPLASDPAPFTFFTDPLNPGSAPVNFAVIFQSNFDLGPETGETRTIGFDWTPSFFEGFQLSMTLNDTRTEDVFSQSDQFLIGAEDQDLQDFYANNASFIEGFIFRDPDTGAPIGLASTTTNFGSLRNRALDFNTSYSFDTDAGSFVVGLNGTYTGRNTQGFPLGDLPTNGGAARNRDGTENGPDTWVGNAFVNYSRDQLDLNMFVNYSSSYINSISNLFNGDVDEVRVEGYWTVDVTGSYSFDDHGIKLNAGVRNLTDNDAPFYNFTTRFGGAVQNLMDPARVDFRGRMAYLEVTKSFEF